MENSLEFSKCDKKESDSNQNNSFKLLNITKNMYNELPINDSIKKRNRRGDGGFEQRTRNHLLHDQAVTTLADLQLDDLAVHGQRVKREIAHARTSASSWRPMIRTAVKTANARAIMRPPFRSPRPDFRILDLPAWKESDE